MKPPRQPVLDCSGGRRHFGIMPDGTVYRCIDAALARSNQWAHIGNVLDPRTQLKILAEVNDPWPCLFPCCSSNCSRQFTVQKLTDGQVSVPGWLKPLVNRHYASVHWEVTNVCQFSCDYCCMREWKARWHGRVMTTGKCLEFVCWFLSAFETGDFNLVGGEPTMHEAFPEAVSAICNAGWTCLVKTNLAQPQRLLEATRAIKQENRAKLLVEWSVHTHQPRFSWDGSRAFLEAFRAISPSSYVAAALIDYRANHEALPVDFKEALNRLGIRFRIVPDSRRLDPVEFPRQAGPAS